MHTIPPFPDQKPLSIAIHSSGLQYAIGLTEKLLIYYILINDTKLVFEAIAKNITAMAYGNGG